MSVHSIIGKAAIRAAAVVAIWMFVLPLPDEEGGGQAGSRRQAGSGFIPVVGFWTDTIVGGEPSIAANGERWSGSTPLDSLRGTGARLFGSASASFLANVSSAGAFPHAVAAAPASFSDGTLRVQFNLVGGQSDQIAGVLFGLGANGEYFYVRYNTRDGNLAVWSFANGERKVLQHGAVHKQLPLGTWHELVVTIEDRSVRGVIAGDTTLSVSHTLEAAPVGRVGVWTKRDAITVFRSFRAQASP